MTDPLLPDDLADLNDAAAGLMPDDPTAVGSTYGRTDWDNGRRLALYEASNLRYVNDVDAWYTWCDNRWCVATRGDQIGAAARVALRIAQEAIHVEDDDDRARHAQWSQSSLSEHSLRSMISVASGLDELRTSWSEFDARSDWLNFPNCTLNPLTLDWHPHSRADMLTQICPTPYVADATSKRLDDFLTQFLSDKEEREYLLQVLAVSSLSSGNAARRLVLLIGPTTTGKSTLMDLVQRTLGRDYTAAINPSIFRGNLDDKPRPDLLRALKTRLALAFEASDHWELHADQIKRMTGGDPITARGMRSDVMNESVAAFVPFIIANAVPRIHGVDRALRQRLSVLVMDASVAENDDDGKLRGELVRDPEAQRALLALLVRVYHECRGRVNLPLPIRFAEALMDTITALDDVDEVLQALKDEGSIYPVQSSTPVYHCVHVSVLYRCYTTWIKRDGTQRQNREKLSVKNFSQRLVSLGYEIQRSNGTRVVGWAVGDTSTTNIARF